MIFLGDRIEFPLNGKIYFKKGVKAFELGRQKDAIKYLDKAFECTENTEVNLYYAFVLSVYNKYQEALDVMNEQKDFYIESESHALFYTELLIKNNQFLEAEYIIQKYQLDSITENNDSWKELEKDLGEKRERYNQNEKLKKKKISKSLRNLQNYSASMQTKIVSDADDLELPNLQKLAPTILSNYQLDEKTRRAFLELLIQREDKNIYPFLWFDQIRKVCPSDLVEFEQIEAVQKLQEILEEKLSKYPDLYYWAETEITHDLLLLYPYIEEVISDLDFWTDLYIMELDFFDYVKIERTASNKEEEEMEKMVRYLHTISQRTQNRFDK